MRAEIISFQHAPEPSHTPELGCLALIYDFSR
jgi:hypothetical protein